MSPPDRRDNSHEYPVSRRRLALLTWPILQRGDRRRLSASSIRAAHAQSGDLRHRDRGGARHLDHVRDAFARPADRASTRRSRCGCGSPCCSPTSPRRSPKSRQGAGRRAARACAPTRAAKRLVMPTTARCSSRCAAERAAAGEFVLVEAGDVIPADGDMVEGVASVNEAAVTGEIRAGDPRIGRRPLGRHRRHHGAVRLDYGARSRRSPARPSSTA